MKRAHYSATLCAVASLVFFSGLTSQPGLTQSGQPLSGQPQSSSSQQAASLESRLPLLFEQNAGQTNSEVRYLTRSGPYQIHLTQNAALLKIAGKDSNAVLRIAPRNANQNAAVVGTDQQAAKTNYLIGARSDWKTGIANFAAVKYEGIYPGIDLKYYGHQRQLEYDFDVAPHADPSTISLNIEGTDKITTDKDGSLVLTTAAGEVRWLKPVAYQELRSGRKNVEAAYLVDGNRISFKLGAYDRSKSLIIDPALVYGTFLNGSTDDYSIGFMVDSAGYAYIVGSSISSDFPVTPGAYQTQNTQNGKGFVSKLSQDGSSLVWSTFIGGTGPDNGTFPNGLTLDAEGDVYLVGTTGDFTYNDNGSGQLIPQVSTFPTTPGAYNGTELAGWREFLVKLNNTGTALDFSTFLSTEPNIIPYAVALDAASNVYVAGYYSHASAQTAAFPATPGAYQSTYGGDKDAYVMKFNPTGTGLVYATLVGGQYDDAASQISVDAYGDATINGPTYSPNYPITSNGLRQTSGTGGFITTLNPTGTGLLYSTVLNNVQTINVKRDTAGYYYAGGSAGLNLPTTAGAFQRTFPSTATGTHQGFLTEIDPSGNLVYSSYLGGNVYIANSEDTQVLLVSPGSVVVGGDRYYDSTFPVTDRAYEQDSCSFLAKFDTQSSSAASLVYSGCTPVNGTNNVTEDLYAGFGSFSGSQLSIDADDNLYAINRDGPTTASAFQPKPNPTEGDGAYIWFGKYNLSQPDTGGVSLSSPSLGNGLPYPDTVEFRATGRSPQCSAGVAAMRVYTEPGVVAYTTLSATLNANITFPVPGLGAENFNPVIVVYDNCGKAFSLTIPIVVLGSNATPANPLVVSPTNGTNFNYPGNGPVGAVTSPVHFVASATAPNCSKGVSAMRIYTAPGVNAYTTSGGSLDTYLKMANGTYNVTVQAWDNCGNVYKSPLQVTVE
jgi:hypothetical protein